MAIGHFNGLIYTANLSLKNLSSRSCSGDFKILERDFSPAGGSFNLNGIDVIEGTVSFVLEPGESALWQLKKTDQEPYQGFGVLSLDSGCEVVHDVELTGDVFIAKEDPVSGYQIVDQFNLKTASNPSTEWGVPVRKVPLPFNAGVSSTALASAPCEAGPYRWKVDYFDPSGKTHMSRSGYAIGSAAIFVSELFGDSLPEYFDGYATVLSDKPIFLEALTVISGDGVAGQVQISDLPTRGIATSPYLQHELSAEFQEHLDQFQERFKFRGVSTAVLMHDQPIWFGSTGYSHDQIILENRSFFRIGSITKTYTAAVVLKMAEQGLIDLDSPIERWIDDFENVDRSATVRQLLNNTSGIYNFTNHPSFWNDIFVNPGKIWMPEMVLKYIEEPEFPPGDRFSYSNTNYILLGMIIREVAGKSYSQQLRKLILDPFRLSETFLEVEETVTGMSVHGWYDFDNDGSDNDISLDTQTAIDSAAWTAGAVSATAADLVRFSQMLFDQRKIISPAFLEQMLEFNPVIGENGTKGYGLGIQLKHIAGKDYWASAGAYPGYNAVLVYSPEDRASLAFLINHHNVSSNIEAVFIQEMFDLIAERD
jgi:D-alanyl-D-alanine carboxypeptidase